MTVAIAVDVDETLLAIVAHDMERQADVVDEDQSGLYVSIPPTLQSHGIGIDGVKPHASL